MAEVDFDERNEVTISLRYPFECDAVRYDSLTMRRPKMKDMLYGDRLTGSDLSKAARMIAHLCDVAPNVVEQVDAIDLKALTRQLEDFTERQSAT